MCTAYQFVPGQVCNCQPPTKAELKAARRAHRRARIRGKASTIVWVIFWSALAIPFFLAMLGVIAK